MIYEDNDNNSSSSSSDHIVHHLIVDAAVDPHIQMEETPNHPFLPQQQLQQSNAQGIFLLLNKDPILSESSLIE